MAPSKKQENNEGAHQEPQLPENSYPFSQKFRPQLQAEEVPSGTDAPLEAPQHLANAKETAKLGTSTETVGLSSGSAIPPSSSPELSPTPPNTFSVPSDQHPSQATLPPVSPQSRQSPTPQETQHSAHKNGPSPLPTDSDGTASEAIPMPASAFSHADYLTDAEAQAYIHKDDKPDPHTAKPSDDQTNEFASNGNATHDNLTANGAFSPQDATPYTDTSVPQASPAHDTRATVSPTHRLTTDKATMDAEQTGAPEITEQPSSTSGTTESATDRTANGTTDNTTEDTKTKGFFFKGKGKKVAPNKNSAQETASEKKQTAKGKVPQPKYSFSATHPILTLPPSTPGGLSNAIFTTCSFAPWIFLTLFFVLQTLFTLDVRALWYSDEVRHAAVFTSMLQEGNIFKLELNGQLYPDKPSLYFWFLRGLYEIFQEEGPRLYFASAAISGLLLLWATLLLGRLVGRFDGRSLFAGGILLISTSYFMGVTHYARMDLLFSTFIVGSYIAFFMAFAQKRSPLLMILAFSCAGLACITKGPLGFALPLSALLLFALWRGKITRLFAPDVLLGLVVALLIVGGWLAGLAGETSLPYIQEQVFGKQVLERAVDAFHHKAKWHYYLQRLPILLLPWVSLIICLPFHKIISKKAWSVLNASRTDEREGQAFLWCIVISAFALLSAISTKIIIYMLPVLPAMCLLAGRAVLHLSGKRALLFKFLLGLTLLVAGLALFVGTLKVFGTFALPDFIDKHIPAWQISTSAGFFMSTGVLCAFALFLLFGIPSSRPEGVLLTLALMSTALAYPLFGMAAPTLDSILSPKAQGELFKEYIAEGYHPLTYDMYDGIYTYYAQSTIDEVYSVDEIASALAEHPRVILAIQQRALNKLTNMPECFEPIHKQMIEQHEYVMLACPPLPSKEMSEPEAQVTEKIAEQHPEQSVEPAPKEASGQVTERATKQVMEQAAERTPERASERATGQVTEATSEGTVTAPTTEREQTNQTEPSEALSPHDAMPATEPHNTPDTSDNKDSMSERGGSLAGPDNAAVSDTSPRGEPTTQETQSASESGRSSNASSSSIDNTTPRTAPTQPEAMPTASTENNTPGGSTTNALPSPEKKPALPSQQIDDNTPSQGLPSNTSQQGAQQ